jgi:hypothetical protein
MMRPSSLPLEWLNSRASSPEVLLQKWGDGGSLGELVRALRTGDEIRNLSAPDLLGSGDAEDSATRWFETANRSLWLFCG